MDIRTYVGFNNVVTEQLHETIRDRVGDYHIRLKLMLKLCTLRSVRQLRIPLYEEITGVSHSVDNLDANDRWLRV